MDPVECPSCLEDQAYLRQKRRPSTAALANSVRVADLFCGAGGLSIGIAEACARLGLGFEVALALDSDPMAIKTFQDNVGSHNAISDQIEAVFDGRLGSPATAAERAIRKRIGGVDLLVGGPPCQGVSSLNNRTRMDDPRNALYDRMARATEVLRPEVVIIENVPGAAKDTAGVVGATISVLVACGYSTRSLIVEMSALGVPQYRKRLLVIGVAGSVGVVPVLNALQRGCEHPRTVRWAIGDLVGVDSTGLDAPSRLAKRSQKRIEYLFKQGRYDLPNALRPFCHMKDHSYRSMYGRLAWDTPAQTITSGFGSMGQGRFVHPELHRTLTAHEAARLQTFPDWYAFPAEATRTQIAGLIANAVPPLANVSIGRSLLESLRYARASHASEAA